MFFLVVTAVQLLYMRHLSPAPTTKNSGTECGGTPWDQGRIQFRWRRGADRRPAYGLAQLVSPYVILTSPCESRVPVYGCVPYIVYNASSMTVTPFEGFREVTVSLER